MHPAAPVDRRTAARQAVAALAVLTAVLLALLTVPPGSSQPTPAGAAAAGAVTADRHDTGTQASDGWAAICTTPAGTCPAPGGERTPHAHLPSARTSATALPVTDQEPASSSPAPCSADHGSGDRERAPPARPGV